MEYFLWWNHPNQVSVIDLVRVVTFFRFYSRPSDDVRLVGGDVPVDYEGVCGDFMNLKMMCHLSLAKELIGLGVVCAFRGVSVCSCM